MTAASVNGMRKFGRFSLALRLRLRAGLRRKELIRLLCFYGTTAQGVARKARSDLSAQVVP